MKLELDGIDVELYRHEKTGVLTVDICTCDVEEKDQWDGGDALPRLRINVNEATISICRDGSVADEDIYHNLAPLERLAECAE